MRFHGFSACSSPENPWMTLVAVPNLTRTSNRYTTMASFLRATLRSQLRASIKPTYLQPSRSFSLTSARWEAKADPLTGELTALPDIEVSFSLYKCLSSSLTRQNPQASKLKIHKNTSPKPIPASSSLVFGHTFVSSTMHSQDPDHLRPNRPTT